jgi:magnesium transporter
MNVSCHQIDESLRLRPLPPERGPAACQDTDARVWVDLHDPSSGELEDWLDRLGVTALSRRLCLEARDRPGFYPLKNEVFLVIPAIVETGATAEVDYLACLCRENFLLTLHRTPLINPQQIASLHESEAWLPDRSIAALFSAMMVDMSLKCRQHIAAMRQSVIELEQRMDREPDSVEAEEILDRRSELLTYDTVVGDQLPALQGLSATDRPAFRLRGAQDYMNCTLANLGAADRRLERLGERVNALHAGFQMHAQDMTNRRLNLLTILSAIFLPITLLAGVWGMNFETMPELKYPFAYPAALGLMTLIGSGMYLFFRRTGWFD